MDIISHVMARRMKRVVEKPVFSDNTLGRLDPTVLGSMDARSMRRLERYQSGTEPVDVMVPLAKLVLMEDVVILLR